MELIHWGDRAKYAGVQGIYVVINRISRDRFVGKAHDLARHLEQHRSDLEDNCAVAMPRMVADFKSYGIDSFRFGLAEKVRDVEQLDRKEEGWCTLLRPYYNAQMDFKRHNWVQLPDDIKSLLGVLLAP